MKKLLSTLLVLVLLVSGLLSLAGCDDKPESTADVTDTATTLGDTTTVAETESPVADVSIMATHTSFNSFTGTFNDETFKAVLDGEAAELYVVSTLNRWYGEGEAAKSYTENQSIRHIGTVTTEGDYKVFRITAAYCTGSVEGDGAEDYLRETLAEIEESLADTSLDAEERREYEDMRDMYNGLEVNRTHLLVEMDYIVKMKIDERGNLLEIVQSVGGNDNPTYRFVYDESGRMISSSQSYVFPPNEENHEAPDGYVQKSETAYYENGMPKSYVTYYDEREMTSYYFDESGNLIDEK